jgi:adenylylsulfate kinase-like enzyme
MLLTYTHRLLDNGEKSHLIWLHGTPGVGKSAVAFTVAERMRSLQVTEQTNVETLLAGTFFFSRENTNRSMTGYFLRRLHTSLPTIFPAFGRT